MNNCKITFCGDEPFTVSGKMEKEGGAIRLTYESEGDSYSIFCRKSHVSYMRCGSLNLEMNLEEGKNTECIISEGGMTGSIPVFAASVRAEISDGAAVVLLKYNLGGEEITLNIAAVEDL